MRIHHYAVLVGCALFFSSSFSAAAGELQEPAAEKLSIEQVSVVTVPSSKQIRPWLKSIKPAAGVIPTGKHTARQGQLYWQQRVKRPRRAVLTK